MGKLQHTVQNPIDQYPKMNIPEQQQKEPGLDEELSPRAFHGEDSYIGAGRLKGRKAIVTGGDSGIGRAIVIAFAKEGADVVFTHLPSEKKDARRTKEITKGSGVEVKSIEVDFDSEKDCIQVVEEAVNNLGGLDLLVNNAGKQVYVDDITKLSSKQLTKTFTVNVFAMFWMVKAAMKYLKKGAVIINTSSIQATQPSEGLLDYAATKAAITNFTRGLSQQLAPKGIRVNAVAPGPIWTPLQPSHGQPMEKLTSFGSDTPYGRAGQPAELAPAYVFLASQESSYISGEVIGVTGAKLR